MIDEVAWMVEVGDDNFIAADEIYWPDGSYTEGGFVFSQLEDTDDGSRVLSLGPFNNGAQIVQSIKFIGKLNNGGWDQLSNGQLPFYDIYMDFSPQGGDPYVFFISPQEGSLVEGSTQLVTTGTANNVEYWVNGEVVANAENGPPFIGTWIPSNDYFGLSTIYAIAYGDNNRVTITPLNVDIPVSVTNQNPVQECNDGLTVNGSNIKICLYAPGKDYIAIKGSWNSEFPNGELMKLSSDGFWWYEGSLPNGEYYYQFNLEGQKRIADPWSKNVIWKDIIGVSESGDYNQAKTVFNIGESTFDWSDDSFVRPAMNELIIYELHIGDFSPSIDEYGLFDDVVDKIESGYFENLGINAIELMPVNEFEGEYSWVYNPCFYMARESSYGSPDDFKNLIG